MKLPLQKTAAAVLVLLLLTAIVAIGIAMKSDRHPGYVVSGWEQKWASTQEADVEPLPPASQEGWTLIQPKDGVLMAPEGTRAAWLRCTLPRITRPSAMLIEKTYGNEIKAFVNNVPIYDSAGKMNYNGTKILIPLHTRDSGQMLYLWSGGDSGMGIEGEVRVGSYGTLLSFYAKQNLMDIVLGGALIFMAAVLTGCILFLKRELFFSGFLLVLVILSAGTIIIAYSPYLPLIISHYGRWVEMVFDLALFTLLPSFTYYFEKIFGPGKNNIVTRVRKFQIGYSLFCFCLWTINQLMAYRLDGLYKFMTVSVVGVLMILQFVFLLVLVVGYAYRGNKDACIFSAGLAVFALLSLTELCLFYSSGGTYYFFWWKWGMVAFLISLIIILGRRFALNHEQVVQYSRELEKFNNDLQRSEKMEIISELAASVAHEVRNPLQVTRGFLQIIGERSNAKDKEYLQMAVAELDRAALIITDFLTFAKPGVETVERIDISCELKHVAGILTPMANLQGGEIVLELQDGLQVLGSSSKFKQAFINILKNSVEALQDMGMVTIASWKSGGNIMISVRDNGEGMKVSELARLGEPYYSNKTKGTGLGLMVTFRIVEAMEGSIQFKSKKGEGTEVIVIFPEIDSK